MNTSFLQPKNALQRAEELCSVGQEVEAFELLQRTILDRKFRYLQWDALAQQAVVMRFLSLAVKLDRIKQSRDGLLNYRNHCQHGMSMLGPVEKVILHFRESAESRVEEAAAAAAADPNSALKQQLHEIAIRVCMDTYRAIIDVIRSTPKLGKVYHSTVVKAHKFCQKYGLRGDFRRLADLVRSNYATIMKQTPKVTDSVVDPQLLIDIDELKRPEVHIETKLSQLRTAVALESWREAQLSIDELFQLGILDLATFRPGRKSAAAQAATQRKQEVLLNCIALYFEYAADYFLRCDFMKLHALSLYRYLMQVRSRLLDQDKLRRLSSITVLAILAVPIESEIAPGAAGHLPAAGGYPRTPFEEEERRLAGLIGYGHLPPQRQELIQLVIDKKILDATHPGVRALFENVTAATPSNPHEVLRLEEVVRAEMSADSDHEKLSLAAYEKSIKICVLKKSIQSVSQIYMSLDIDRFKKEFCPPEFLEWRIAEREIAASSAGCIKFDFSRNAIFLNSRQTALDSRRKLAALSSNLQIALLEHNKVAEAAALVTERTGIRKLLQVTTKGKAGALSRLELIKAKREEVANLKRALHEAREDAERERGKKLADQEEQKILDVKKELEEGRRARELEIAKIQLAKITAEKIEQLVKQICEDSKIVKKSNLAEIQNLDAQKIIDTKLTSKKFTKIVQKIISDKFEEKKLEARIQYKRHDHLARALRATKVEIVKTKLIPELQEHVDGLKKASQEERDSIAEIIAQRNEVLKQYKDAIVQYF